MPKRVRLTPPMKMDEGARKWMYQYAQRHYWRVCSWLDLDDLFQEGYDAYYEACRRYPTAYDRPHIMRLFMLTYRSRIERLAAQKRYQLDMPVEVVPDYQWTAADNHMSMLIAHAPKHVKAVLDLANTEKGRRSLRSISRRRFDGTRETLDERLRRLVGLNNTITWTKNGKMESISNLVEAVRNYFSETENARGNHHQLDWMVDAVSEALIALEPKER